MTVSELIGKLKTMPQDAEIKYIYDGAAYGETDLAWIANDGRVMLCAYNEPVYSDDARPFGAPSAEEERHWYTPENPNKTESEF